MGTIPKVVVSLPAYVAAREQAVDLSLSTPGVSKKGVGVLIQV